MLEDLVGLITKHLAVEARWVCSAVCCWPKADMTVVHRICPLSGPQMSASDPKRTLRGLTLVLPSVLILALSGHGLVHRTCPLSEVKRTRIAKCPLMKSVC